MARLLALIVACLLTIGGARAGPLARGEPIVFVDEPEILAALERRGLAFADLAGAPGATSLAQLIERSATWRAIASRVRDDVGELRADMLATGRKLYEVTDGNVGRVMNLGWLTSPVASFRLAAVVNRMDRRDFHAAAGDAATCGEIRLIYRLAYRFEDAGTKRLRASRMPFNLNVVLNAPKPADGDCAAAARAFTAPRDVAPGEAAAFLADGPPALRTLAVRQIEVNAQIVRFPSGMEVEFGGQAVYLLRVFGLANGAVLEKPLENTPDVERLKADAAMRRDLLAYVRANLPAIDSGAFAIPDRMLAKKALSYSTFGSARLANHPFAALFREADFAGLDFDGRKAARSARGLIERLDNASCMGCHQMNATAGFHVIGRDDAEIPAINRVRVGVSPHVGAELPRRRAYVAALAEGGTPDAFRPHSAATPAVWSRNGRTHRAAGAGMPCLAGADAAALGEGFACAARLQCRVIGADARLPLHFGQCLATREADVFSGHPCLVGEIQPAKAPWLERFRSGQPFIARAKGISDHAYTCRPPKLGVPGGAAYRKCTRSDREFEGFLGGGAPAEICGFAGGKAFDDCVATNDFSACLGRSIVRGNRPTCGPDRFCREDFMCQELPPDTPGIGRVKGHGYCSPTYFLFQMRIDGHPDPKGRV